MGKVTGFIELERIQEVALPPAERVRNYREFVPRAQRGGRVESRAPAVWIAASLLYDRLSGQ